MRLFIVGALFFVTTSAAAQSRWTFSTGPEWSRGIPQIRTWGARLRAEYDITRPNSVFGIRLETGARWSPTQSYFYSDGIGTWAGTEQQFDLLVGLNASLSPLPRARVSPYVAVGIFGRQEWTYGSRFFGTSSSSTSTPVRTYSRGDIVGSLGLGFRARVGGRSFQLELRRLYDHNGVTFGTRLPF